MKMQVSTILAFLIACLAVLYVEAGCPGKMFETNCSIRWTAGTRTGRGCSQREGQMWAWDSNARRCIAFFYLGCGGNANRFCTQGDCVSRCQSRPGSPGK